MTRLLIAILLFSACESSKAPIVKTYCTKALNKSYQDINNKNSLCKEMFIDNFTCNFKDVYNQQIQFAYKKCQDGDASCCYILSEFQSWNYHFKPYDTNHFSFLRTRKSIDDLFESKQMLNSKIFIKAYESGDPVANIVKKSASGKYIPKTEWELIKKECNAGYLYACYYLKTINSLEYFKESDFDEFARDCIKYGPVLCDKINEHYLKMIEEKTILKENITLYYIFAAKMCINRMPQFCSYFPKSGLFNEKVQDIFFKYFKENGILIKELKVEKTKKLQCMLDILIGAHDYSQTVFELSLQECHWTKTEIKEIVKYKESINNKCPRIFNAVDQLRNLE